MLKRYRRYWALLLGVMLVGPLTVGLIAPDDDSTFVRELRPRAAAPGFPGTLAELRAIPGQLDRYFPDHFGMRSAMLHMHAVLHHIWLGSGSVGVQIADEGRFFYRDDKAPEQSAGLLVRMERVRETAKTLASIRDALAAQGTRFVFASPPNSATVMSQSLPSWARRGNRKTEYSLLLEALAAHGVETVDLRTPLIEASRSQVYLKHDTHWTERGALIGFNAIVKTIGRGDWSLDPMEALGRAEPIVGGDLARMLGVAQDVSEVAERITLPEGKQEILSTDPMPTFQLVAGREGGAAVLIIGDSFTWPSFHKLARVHAARFAWTHHKQCGVDWKWIDQFRPTEVWWMPTERFMLCAPGVRPAGLPETVNSGL